MVKPPSNSGELWRPDDDGGGDDDDDPVSLCSFVETWRYFVHWAQIFISSTQTSDQKSVKIKYFNNIGSTVKSFSNMLLQILAVVLRQLLRIRDSRSPLLLANLI